LIRILSGDLLEAEEDVIVHQVNCQSRFGSGIALQVRNRYPSAYKDYMDFSSGKRPIDLLGKVVLSPMPNHRFIAHLFGQLNYGYEKRKYTSYDALFDGLTYIKNSAKKAGKSIAIPYRLGSDRGGANWEIVYKIIGDVFFDYDVTIYRLEA